MLRVHRVQNYTAKAGFILPVTPSNFSQRCGLLTNPRFSLYHIPFYLAFGVLLAFEEVDFHKMNGKKIPSK
jgi:hypothetical protein